MSPVPAEASRRRRRMAGHGRRSSPEDQAAHNPAGARRSVALILAVTAIALVVQAGGDAAFLRGDSAFFLRDASTFASGEIARSRYSPGYALFLAPVAALTDHDLTLFGRSSLLVTAALAIAALWAVHQVLRLWLAPWLAVGALALVSLGQGVIVYFSEVRSEPLTLLLVATALLALDRGRGRWSVVLLGAAVITRVAMAPFAAALWLAWLRRDRRVALAGLASAAVGVLVHLSTGPVVDAGYAQIGGAALDDDGTGGGLVRALTTRAAEGLEAYGRFGVPRLVWPYAALRSPLGWLLAALALVLVTVGLATLLRRRPVAAPPLLSATAIATVPYGALLVAWPIRDLAAIRLVMPGVIVPLAAVAAGAASIGRRLAGGDERRGAQLATAGLLGLAALGAVASAVSVDERYSEGAGLLAYVEAHQVDLPPGPLMSGKPGISELVTHRTAYEYPVEPDDVVSTAERTATCLFALEPTDRGAPAIREALERRGFRVISTAGRTEIVKLSAPWCP